MSADEHDHHDHSHEHAASTTDAALAPLPPTPEHGFWRSMRELEGEAPFQTDRSGKEFSTAPDRAIDPMHRRNFFQLMGASMALAGMGAGCRRYEKEEIVPLSRRPEDQTPSQTQAYATSFELGGVGHALIATAYEGRPIKLDGNPEHPFASGGIVPGTERHAGSSAWAQAAILHLYDPDRSQNPVSAGKGTSLEGFRNALIELRKTLGQGRILSEASSSPTIKYLREQLLAKYPGLSWHEYEPLSWDNERIGTKMAFGRSLRPIARLDKAETIVTIDCDLFVEHPASMRYSRDFARSRKLNGSLGIGKMNRLWSIESTFSNTGAMADHRLPLRSELGLPFAMALDAMVGGGQPPGSKFLEEAKVAKFVSVLAAELKANRGRAVVVAGRRQPPEVHAIVARINQSLGAPGATLDYVEDPDADRQPHLASITALAKDMAAGKVQSLIILGGNPVYDAPADLEFAAALAKVPTSVHLSEYQNETSQKTSWHVPKAHFLEAWGDTRTWDGTITIAQPLIAPLYGGLASSELLSMLLGDELGSEQLLRAAHEKLGVPATWRQHVHDGFVAGTQLPVATVALGSFGAPSLTESQKGVSKRGQGDIEVVFHYSSFTYDGRYANNAWMQETPDFLTKVTWDNYALVGPETAEALNLKNNTMITVKVEGRSIELPCYTIPGQARYSIGLVLGGGRTAAGRVGGQGDKNRVGWDTYKVRTTTGFDIAGKATVTGGGSKYELASIQEHWDIRASILGIPAVTRGEGNVNAEGLAERLPELIKQTTAAKLNEDRSWRAEEPEGFFADPANAGNTDRPGTGGYSLFKEKDYAGHRWGMAIDLSTCTGCNACMVACQAENNVPVVGRNEVINNREMSWIRIDRYFSGSVDDPQVVHQPIACQHCEQAPCETVCPVGATTHSDEGLNDMAYNRCIGTRYCANNCPYKVRRFNFLDWNKEWREARNKVRNLLFNPDVTVRMRGVMEKCNYCVQRIQEKKITAKAENHRPLKDGEILTACQQVCPADAIVFGDINNPESRVTKLRKLDRDYAVLGDLAIKPRTTYLAKLRNPNPELA